jgi:hypothetical protein
MPPMLIRVSRLTLVGYRPIRVRLAVGSHQLHPVLVGQMLTLREFCFDKASNPHQAEGLGSKAYPKHRGHRWDLAARYQHLTLVAGVDEHHA